MSERNDILRMAARRGAIKRIHVNKHVIASNAKHGTNEPAITVQTSKGSTTARRVDWDGPSTMVHDGENPLSCGAKVWIETYASLDVDGSLSGAY
jgi:hypothetical protein